MGDEFETSRERIEAHPTIKGYLASRTADQLAELIWSEMHRGNVFGSYKGTVGDHSRAILAAVEAETAERVERETREADAQFIEAHSLGNHGLVRLLDDDKTLRPVATAIRSLPTKYGAKT